MRKRILVLAVLFFPPGLAFGEDSIQFVKTAYEQLADLQKNEGDFRLRTTHLVRGMYDFNSFCSLTLEDLREKLSPVEQGEFCRTFEEVFFRNMAKKGLKLADKRLRDVHYKVLEAKTTSSAVLLSGKVDQTKANIRFDLLQKSGQWKISDITVNDVRLSRNYRGQFNWIFRNEKFEGLIARMNKKLDQFALSK